jgi:hypothetical protein
MSCVAPDNNSLVPGTPVFDISDPDKRGVLRVFGIEQCEVKFDGDQASRIIQTKYLGVVGADDNVVVDGTAVATIIAENTGVAGKDGAGPPAPVHDATAVLAAHTRAIREIQENARKRTVEDIVAILQHLHVAKEDKRVKHGQWLAWIERDFDWSDQTGRNFVHVYLLSRDLKFKTVLNMEALPIGALYKLAAPKAEEARQQIGDRIAAGEHVAAADIVEAVADKSKQLTRESGSEPEPKSEPRSESRSEPEPRSEPKSGSVESEHVSQPYGKGGDQIDDPHESDPRVDLPAPVDPHPPVDFDDLRKSWAKHPPSADDVISVLPTQVCRALADRLVVFGTKRSPKLTKILKNMVRDDSYAEKFRRLKEFTDAIGDDEFEVRTRASN